MSATSFFVNFVNQDYRKKVLRSFKNGFLYDGVIEVYSADYLFFTFTLQIRISLIIQKYIF